MLYILKAVIHPHKNIIMNIRPFQTSDKKQILNVINQAAYVYKGVIPDDCWHEPYMAMQELQHEIADGVRFYVLEDQGVIQAVMGMQDKDRVQLIRHAYVKPGNQRGGLGGQLLSYLLGLLSKPVLVGTWQAAHWAVAFYEKHDFVLADTALKDKLLARYWKISPRQMETSVVLSYQGHS